MKASTWYDLKESMRIIGLDEYDMDAMKPLFERAVCYILQEANDTMHDIEHVFDDALNNPENQCTSIACLKSETLDIFKGFLEEFS